METTTEKMSVRAVGSFIVELGAARDDARVGGKARSLAALIAAGFPVPAGFVLPTDAFEQCRAGNEISMTGEVRRALLDAATKLPKPLAVRSSAVGEDGGEASFAGQYETVLDVEGSDELVAAVLRCWRSAFSERIVAYRRQRGITEPVRIAVVVQHMLRPSAAGVVFTANPVTGDRSEAIVSAVCGLGERLVSGEAAPDEWTVRGDHAECRRASENSIDAKRATEIAALARAVETRFGSPQDIEWAIADGKLWLLQARPITALPEHVEWKPPRGGWHRNFRLGEWLPEPMTPLFESWLLPRLENGLNGFYRRHSGVHAAGPDHVVLHGWYFGSLNFIPSPPVMLWQLLTGVLPRFVTNGWRAFAALPPLHSKCVDLFVDDWRALLVRYREAARESLDGATADDLVTTIDTLADLAGEYFGFISLIGGYAWKTEIPLARFCREHLPDIEHAHLLAGLFAPRHAVHDVQSIDWFHATHGELALAAPHAGNRREALENRRREAESRARTILTSKLLPRFDRLLSDAQKFCRLRDEIVSELTIAWPTMRLALGKIADTLELPRDDIYFLTLDELRTTLSGAAIASVSGRRDDWSRQRLLVPPLVLGDPPSLIKNILADAESTFRGAPHEHALATGLAASPGTAKGIVRIIRNVEDFARFRDGDVLVARATTPVWTVLFPRASAVVTDIGSVIAHAALVAREYGIPAIVGTGNATLVLREGQRVIVDGTRGVVLPGGDQ